MDEYRLSRNDFLETLQEWNRLMPGRGKVHLIACGGTALTLLGYKDSTKDVDLLVPDEREYARLVEFLESAGYKQVAGDGWMRDEERIIYDLYRGKRIFTTELLDSPLEEGRHKKILELTKIYLGVLNPIDWIISKMFRGTQVDRDDCIALVKNEPINLKELEDRFKQTAKYDTSEERVLGNLELILDDLKEIQRGK